MSERNKEQLTRAQYSRNNQRKGKTIHVVRHPHNHQQSSKNIVSIAPTTQVVSKQSEVMKDELTTGDRSDNETNKKYAVGDICMIVQTNRCLQFCTACIQQISKKSFSYILDVLV